MDFHDHNSGLQSGGWGHPRDPLGFCSPQIKRILSEIGFIQGPDCRLHPGGVAAPGPCSEAPVEGCDAGEQPHLSG